MENIVSEKIDRRKFLAGAGVASSLVVLPLAGCSTGGKQAGGDQPHYVMVFDQNKCVGCRDCRDACNEANKLPKGRSRLLFEQQGDKVEGQRGYAAERRYVRVSCQQCKDAPCVSVCPTGAAYRDPKTGIVTMDADKCVGCKYCIVACPYNVRFINEQTKVADNCDFCLHSRLEKNEQPACVESCKYDALVFGDVNDPKSYVSRLLAVKDSVRIRPELGTEPSLRYIPIVKKGV